MGVWILDNLGQRREDAVGCTAVAIVAREARGKVSTGMDVEQFELVYRRYAPAILGYARRCAGRADIAEDIVSEAFLELLRNRESIAIDRLPAWLYTVVRNRAIDYWRHQKLEANTPAPTTSGNGHAEQFDWSVLEASGLNETHRACLMLRYVHGMNREEIADMTGLRETQVKGYLRYGLELLRKKMITEPGAENK